MLWHPLRQLEYARSQQLQYACWGQGSVLPAGPPIQKVHVMPGLCRYTDELHVESPSQLVIALKIAGNQQPERIYTTRKLLTCIFHM
jgi:hypothetical protein